MYIQLEYWQTSNKTGFYKTKERKFYDLLKKI